MKFKEIWFRGLNPEDKKRLEQTLSNSLIMEKLREIILSFERELPVSKKDYDNPSWPYYQAHLNGMTEYHTRIKSLLFPEDQKENK